VRDSSWTNWGYPFYPIVICLFIAWTLCGLSISRGVKTVGKVVYFTATFPFVILTALLIRGLTLEGSWDGVLFYITPEWDRLLNYRVWGDASSQVFYSFSLACGSLVALASYNKVS
jgi:solute carrier family 6 amino acid transporter-like protein 5/7/9/14